MGHRVFNKPYSDTVKTPYSPQKSIMSTPPPKIDKNGNVIKSNKKKRK